MCAVVAVRLVVESAAGHCGAQFTLANWWCTRRHPAVPAAAVACALVFTHRRGRSREVFLDITVSTHPLLGKYLASARSPVLYPLCRICDRAGRDSVIIA